MSPARGASSGLYGQSTPFRNLVIVAAAVLGGVVIGGLSVLGVVMAVVPPQPGPEAPAGSQVFDGPRTVHGTEQGPASPVVTAKPPLNTAAPVIPDAPAATTPSPGHAATSVETRATGQPPEPAGEVHAPETHAARPAQQPAKTLSPTVAGESSASPGPEEKSTRTKTASKRQWRHRRGENDRMRPRPDDDVANDDDASADPRLDFPRPRRPIYDYDRSDRYSGERGYGGGFFGFGRNDDWRD